MGLKSKQSLTLASTLHITKGELPLNSFFQSRLLYFRSLVPVYFVSGCEAVLVSLGELNEFLRAVERTFIGQQPPERLHGAHIHSQRDEHTTPAETLP